MISTISKPGIELVFPGSMYERLLGIDYRFVGNHFMVIRIQNFKRKMIRVCF